MAYTWKKHNFLRGLYQVTINQLIFSEYTCNSMAIFYNLRAVYES